MPDDTLATTPRAPACGDTIPHQRHAYTAIPGSTRQCQGYGDLDAKPPSARSRPTPLGQEATSASTTSTRLSDLAAAPSLSAAHTYSQPLPGAATGSRRRSKAWVYYAILSFVSFIAVFTAGPSALIGFFLCGAYSAYIYRGGRFVFWIW